MVGGRGFVESPTWFEDRFGFQEGSYRDTHRRFEFADFVLTSRANGASFYVGPFETPTLEELRERWTQAVAAQGDTAATLGGLTFENVTGAVKTMILDPLNAGAVFQVASQFNCLEMVEPGQRPESGVTRYYCDATQGPAAALACPAATVYRNYFVSDGRGQAGGAQIDCLADVGAMLDNDKERYWRMTNGYCMPDAPGGIAKVGALLAPGSALAAAAKVKLRVGVHWETEVKGGAHRVCQVFSSAVPVSYAKSVKSAHWQPLASMVLDATYEATLAVGAILSASRGARVTVFLTCVGGGAFGNRSSWIVQAMDRALTAFANAPLDVKLVHFATVPKGAYSGLERGRRSRDLRDRATAPKLAAAPSAPRVEAAAEAGAAAADKVTATFALFDANGDGVISRDELICVLMRLDPTWTEDDAIRIFEAADANGDGDVHYGEFAAWLYEADSETQARVLRIVSEA